jgi:hypothetical protein
MDQGEFLSIKTVYNLSFFSPDRIKMERSDINTSE